MFLRSAAESRPYRFGPFPLEFLKRDDRVPAAEAGVARVPKGARCAGTGPEDHDFAPPALVEAGRPPEPGLRSGRP